MGSEALESDDTYNCQTPFAGDNLYSEEVDIFKDILLLIGQGLPEIPANSDPYMDTPRSGPASSRRTTDLQTTTDSLTGGLLVEVAGNYYDIDIDTAISDTSISNTSISDRTQCRESSSRKWQPGEPTAGPSTEVSTSCSDTDPLSPGSPTSHRSSFSSTSSLSDTFEDPFSSLSGPVAGDATDQASYHDTSSISGHEYQYITGFMPGYPTSECSPNVTQTTRTCTETVGGYTMPGFVRTTVPSCSHNPALYSAADTSSSRGTSISFNKSAAFTDTRLTGYIQHPATTSMPLPNVTSVSGPMTSCSHAPSPTVSQMSPPLPYTWPDRTNPVFGDRGSTPRGKQKRGCRLWEFIRNLLLSPATNPSLIRWENKEEGTFRLVQSKAIANLWGSKKGNEAMTYEKLSRAMRYYYKRQVFEPVLGKRLVYRFGPKAFGWKD